ncbi:MAG: CPBP family intramembrane glutamic endopeptidase [Actinomycetota bacterium]
MSRPIPARGDVPLPDPPVQRPRATWTVFHSFGIFFLGNVIIGQALVGLIVLYLLGATVGPTDGATTPILVASLFADIAMAATIVVWLRLRHEPIVPLLGVPERGRWMTEIAIGIASGAILYVVVDFAVANGVTWLVQEVSNKHVVSPHQLSPALSTAGKVLAAFVSIAIAPAAEELFFRGILFRGVRDRRGFVPAAAVSSVAFGLAHWGTGDWRGSLILVLSMMVTGLGLAFLYEHRKNLVTNIAAHAMFNIIGIVLLFRFPKFGT